ncbi:hypothetical protein MMC13_005739 [Lambiella insularis]|nr:hypothetical protein [Lambiella insularis]
METSSRTSITGKVVFQSGLICLVSTSKSQIHAQVVLHTDTRAGTQSLPTARCRWIPRAEGSSDYVLESFDATARRIAETQTGWFACVEGYHPCASLQPGATGVIANIYLKSPFMVETATDLEGVTTITSWFNGRVGWYTEKMPVEVGLLDSDHTIVSLLDTQAATTLLGDHSLVLKKGQEAWSKHNGHLRDETSQLAKRKRVQSPQRKGSSLNANENALPRHCQCLQ